MWLFVIHSICREEEFQSKNMLLSIVYWELYVSNSKILYESKSLIIPPPPF